MVSVGGADIGGEALHRIRRAEREAIATEHMPGFESGDLLDVESNEQRLPLDRVHVLRAALVLRDLRRAEVTLVYPYAACRYGALLLPSARHNAEAAHSS